MAYAEAERPDLELQLLLCGYEPKRAAGEQTKKDEDPNKYESDLAFAVFTNNLHLTRLLLAFGFDWKSEKLPYNLKHVCVTLATQSTQEASLAIYRLLHKFGARDCDCDKCAQSPLKEFFQRAKADLCVPHHSKTLQQFLDEKDASDSLKRRFCRKLFEEQSFTDVTEILAASDADRLEILEHIIKEAKADEELFGPPPKSKSFHILSYCSHARLSSSSIKPKCTFTSSIESTAVA